MVSTPVTTAAAPGDYQDKMLKFECMKIAATLQPKDAGDLIRKAAGIYGWITRNEVPNNE